MKHPHENVATLWCKTVAVFLYDGFSHIKCFSLQEKMYYKDKLYLERFSICWLFLLKIFNLDVIFIYEKYKFAFVVN